MINGILVSPKAAWLDVVLAANKSGVPATHFAVKGRWKRRVYRPESASRYLGPNRLVYFDSVKDMYAWVDSLQKHRNCFTVVLGGSESEALEYGLTPSKVELSESLITSVVLNPSNHLADFQKPPSGQVTNLYEQVVARNKKDSIIQKLQPLFYRIREVDERKKVQKQVYRFLAGRVKTVRNIPVASMQRLLESPLAAKFRTCVQVYEETLSEASVSKHGIDMFEVHFVLRQLEK